MRDRFVRQSLQLPTTASPDDIRQNSALTSTHQLASPARFCSVPSRIPLDSGCGQPLWSTHHS